MLNLHLGSIGWSYNFWRRSFYPEDLPPKDYLAYYAKKFDTVEVDSTFYRIPTDQVVMNWKEQTPENFVFALKFPLQITHTRKLKDAEARTDVFLSRVKLLNGKLGPLLLQFPPNFGADHLVDLENFLLQLPKSNRYVVEIRNKSWLHDEFYDLLKAHNVAFAWVDNPLHLSISVVTADFLYIRWEGDRKVVKGTLGKLELDRKSDLKLWMQKIKPFLARGMDVFGYFGKYYSGLPPSDIETLQTHLSEDR